MRWGPFLARAGGGRTQIPDHGQQRAAPPKSAHPGSKLPTIPCKAFFTRMNPFRFLPPLFLIAASVASAGTLAHFRPILGALEVELYDQDKPVTVQNFIRYTQRGLYQATLIHRWAPGFVIQGGGFAAADLTNINAVFPLVTGFGTITNEFSLGRRSSNAYGTIAMARDGAQTSSPTWRRFVTL